MFVLNEKISVFPKIQEQDNNITIIIIILEGLPNSLNPRKTWTIIKFTGFKA